ncbi:MAG: hypothetical protein HUU37_03080 [Bdellovibrionales bacterium]|nr:hypothetical protein [Bdellovibrionales bacterium]
MMALRFMVWSVFTFAAILILGTAVARAADRPAVPMAELRNLQVGKFALSVSAADKTETCPTFLVDSAGGRQEWPFLGQASADRRNIDCSLGLAQRGLLAGNAGVKWDTFKPKYSGQLLETELSWLGADQLDCVKLQRNELKRALRDARTLAILSNELDLSGIEIRVEQLQPGPEGLSQLPAGVGAMGKSVALRRLPDGKRRLVLLPVIREGKCFAAHDLAIAAAVEEEFRPIREAREKSANEKAARESEARRKAEEQAAAMNRASQEKEKIDEALRDLRDPRVETDLEIKVSDWWKRVGGASEPATSGSAQ